MSWVPLLGPPQASTSFLVIGGRDASSNEEIYAKCLHTDAPGAPLTVIKTLGLGEEVPESTLVESAQFAVSYSSVWKLGFFEGDCYMVAAEQVTKTPEPGRVKPRESGEEDLKGLRLAGGDRRRPKAVASVDLIVSFLPPGGSRVKGRSLALKALGDDRDLFDSEILGLISP
jgi:hypothetical protein